jgi:hypothetical protein
MSAGSPGVRRVTFAGSPYERGVQRGLRLRDTLTIPDLDGLPRTFVAGCRDAAAALFPPVLDEFEGILAGGGFDREAMEAFYFARLESMLGGCTMAAVTAPDGVLVGRNYDWLASDWRWCEFQTCLPGEGLRRIGYTHHWAGCPDALNEEGLYLAIASLPAAPVTRPGVQWSVLTEMISATCASVEAAVEACCSVNHLRPMSYLFADASGDAAVVEATPRAATVRHTDGALLLVTNVAQGGEVRTAWPDASLAAVGPVRDQAPAGSATRARRRLARARDMLEPTLPAATTDDVMRMLRDHEAPICVGDHGNATGWATIWSGICRPAERDFRIAPGRPCDTDYQAFSLER